MYKGTIRRCDNGGAIVRTPRPSHVLSKHTVCTPVVLPKMQQAGCTGGTQGAGAVEDE